MACFSTLTLIASIDSSAQALDWKASNGFRAAALNVPASGKAGFTQLQPSLTGIWFTNALSIQRYTTNQIYLNGSGVAAGDVDGDRWVDLYFCGLDGPNVLYRNLGQWKFENITEAAGVACTNLDATGAAFADLDGDGDLDLIVNSVNTGTEVFLNDGKGHFTKVAVLNPQKGGMSLTLADTDGDGSLDLYIANYRTDTIRDHPNTRLTVNTNATGELMVLRVEGRPVTEPDLAGRYTLTRNGKIVEHGEEDAFFRNDGKSHFSRIPFTDGVFLSEDGKALTTPPYDWGLSAMFRDINNDGFPDLYVCNDFDSEDRIWINKGDGRFQAIDRVAIGHTSRFSMGVDFADLNRDGEDEIFLADMLSRDHQKRHVQTGDLMPIILRVGQIDNRPQYSQNSLFLNRGDGTYAEIACLAGLEASEWSWTPIFLDVDLDGFEDLLITTGHERDARNSDVINRAEALKAQRKMSKLEMLNLNNLFARLDVPNLAFRNRGDLTFEDASDAWDFKASGVSHGMALVDLDNDGDMDLVINNLNGVAGIYRNNGIAARIAIRLKGLPPNTHGIGAKIKIAGGPVPQTQEMICGGRYLSCDDTMRVFAAGTLTNDLRVEVIWRNGKQTVVEHAQPNHLYELDEANAHPVANPRSAQVSASFFEDMSGRLQHKHQDESFDDFVRQPLLPNKLSQLGPGVAWYDLDGDGWEDLIIGSGRGGRMAVYLNDGKGGFKAFSGSPLAQPVSRDQTTILAWTKQPGKTSILAGSSNYEDGLDIGPVIRQFDLGAKSVDDTLPGQASSTGALTLADIDGDGDLDVFVGGRSIPGHYPKPASSLILKNEVGKLVVHQRFENVGMVTGAVFSDLDGDGNPDLVLASDWGPIRVFRNDAGTFKEITTQLGLEGFKGWWNGVTTGDIDGDGRLDIVAGNWGVNTCHHIVPPHTRRLYYSDFKGRGAEDLVEAYFDESMRKEVPDRGFRAVSAAMPFVLEKIQSYEAYGKASVQDIYGESLNQAKVVEVNTLTSMVFLNRGDRFEPLVLPLEAQAAPVFGVCVGDMDGDGQEDLFLSQNFFCTNPDTPRKDAGRGIWLKGDGKGGLKAVSGQESGITLYGEQRGCALADYDGDGRVDLVVTQNGNMTKLYHNAGAKPGLRVRLNAGPGNPTGVGAALRVTSGQQLGPIREIHAGSGYWSQDSAVQVMGIREEPAKIWVRWPGRKTLAEKIPSGAREIELGIDGSLKVIR